MVSAKGRWADFRTAITRFLRMAEAQTEQLYSIVGITRLFYIEEKLHCARGPKTADSILE
jgi:hypothetical protein